MAYSRYLKTIVYTLTTVLSLSLPLASMAGDITLPKHSKDAQLATFHSSLSVASPSLDAIEDDPVTEVLSMYEFDVWNRIRNGFAIPDLENPLVHNHENYYLRNLGYFDRTTTRASRYLFHIVQEVEKRGMPTELALLPFIESAFNPHARSPAKAEGMWQFIPSTGLHYDLVQSVFRDDRRSILDSTEAALTYLQNLYNLFGDWHLALAAYNWGEGAVGRAVRRNQAAGLPITFNAISSRMPAETRNYVPKFQAVKNLIAAPEKYNIHLPEIENQPYFVKIGKTRDIDVNVAAKLAEMDIDEFRAFNPQFGHYVITGGSDVNLLLPKENAEKFKRNLASWKQPLSSWTAYQVTDPRETVESIAEKYRTSSDVIRHANHIPPNMALRFGSTVLVPKLASGKSYENDISPILSETGRLSLERIGPPIRTVKVKIKKQDNLASIAKRYNTSVGALKNLNRLAHDQVAAGTILLVHAPAKASRRPSKESTTIRKNAQKKLVKASNKSTPK